MHIFQSSRYKQFRCAIHDENRVALRVVVSKRPSLFADSAAFASLMPMQSENGGRTGGTSVRIALQATV